MEAGKRERVILLADDMDAVIECLNKIILDIRKSESEVRQNEPKN